MGRGWMGRSSTQLHRVLGSVSRVGPVSRVVWVCALLVVLAALFPGSAFAANTYPAATGCTYSSGNYSCAKVDQAYSAAAGATFDPSAYASQCPVGASPTAGSPVLVSGSVTTSGQWVRRWACYASGVSSSTVNFVAASFSGGCAAGTTWDSTAHTCHAPCDVNAPALGPGYVLDTSWAMGSPDTHVSVCQGSCQYINNSTTGSYTQVTIDGLKYTSTTGWLPTGTACSTNNANATLPADSDGDGTSDGKDGAPSDPGSDGGNTPTDTNGDGVADCGVAGKPNCPDQTTPSDHTSSGGGDCNTPPVSDGDPILANIVFQTWATRCAILGKANTGPGGGGTTGYGKTDMTETNSLLSGIADKLTPPDADLSEGTAADLARGKGDIWGDGSTPDISAVDMTGFGWARTCPAPIDLTLLGHTVSIDNAKQCEGMQAFGALILAATAAQVAYIFAGRKA